MTMNDIKPIETVYNGYRFRSRLEARWAVFFDAAGIEYQYEPEGFEGFDGSRYLPDFYLPDINIYAEVKPSYEALMKERDKIGACIDYESTPLSNGLVVLGQIPFWPRSSCCVVPHFLYFSWRKGVVGRTAFFCFKDGNFHKKVPWLVSDEYPLSECASETLPDLKERYTHFLTDNGEREVENLALLDLIPSYRTPVGWYEMPFNAVFSISRYYSSCFEKARQARFEHGETPKI